MKLLIVALGFLTALQGRESASVPTPRSREYDWMPISQWKEVHEKHCKRAKEGNVDLLFLGDSITFLLDQSDVWNEVYVPQKAAAFGISGDPTQNILWRIQNGELEGIEPKVVVVLAGANNLVLYDHEPAEIAQGLVALVKALKEKLPAVQILLLGMLPKDEKPGTTHRKKILQLNQMLAPIGKKFKGVRFLDIGPKFLEKDGSISKDVMYDFLHPTKGKGYRIWADALAPVLTEMRAGGK